MQRSGRTIWAMMAFMVGFSLLIWLVSSQFLIPAMAVSSGASEIEKRQLVAYSRLLLAIILFVLCVGILLVFRVHRFFAPTGTAPRQKTEHIDAWAEAGKRMDPD